MADNERAETLAPGGTAEAELPEIEVVEIPDAEDAIRGEQPLPDALPVLPLRETVTFPDTLTPLAVGQERSIKLVNDVLSGNRMLAMVASKDPENDAPGPDDLHRVGVAGTVARMMKVPDGTLRILVQGGERIRINDYVSEQPYLVARIDAIPDVLEPSAELEALTRNVQNTFSEIIEQIPYLPEELQLAVANLDDPSALGHLIAGALRISVEEKQELLEEVDVGKRLRRLSEILTRELEVVRLGTKIQSQVESEIDKGQREFFLRQQMKAIQEELGEQDDQQAEIAELRERIEAAELPEEPRKQAERELGRLEKLPPQAAEYGVIRTYLEWLVDLPWSKQTEDDLDIKHARKILDEDHYDLEEVKDRILEYLAVRKLNPESPGPILCFVGPPGVGKTSLGKSIARALGREFERISVGGVRDEAEIRGHRRTYIGALPGTIIRALRDAGTRNPVFMIDEIDKMGADFRGDPASAMLEVLDPAQNSTFRDHYLDVPFDLSDVLFIATANVLDPIPPAAPGPDGDDPARRLHDRREAAHRQEVPGPPPARGQRAEGIADRVRRPGADRDHRGVHPRGRASATSSARSAPSAARSPARSPRAKVDGKVKVSAKRARELLGKRRVFAELRRRTKDPGVATGLAWTPAGGEILFVEASAIPGDGKLTITGQLGDVMRESAQAALTYVRGHVDELAPDLSDDWFATHDIHIHVPAGAVPKDGPSAGVAMVTALASLVSGKPVSNDVAMTGEITLSGQVLPIGGVKEKALAAQRAGIKTVIVPDRNEADVEEIPEREREKLEFDYAAEIGEALAVAMPQAAEAKSKA